MNRATWWFSVCLVIASAFVLGGCGTSGVTINFTGGTARAIDLGQSLNITVTVANDGGMGVTWACTGAACTTLANVTTTSVTFNATGATGTATITATSIKTTTVSSSVTVTVNALPTVTTTQGQLTVATVGLAYTSVTFTATGGSGTLIWSATGLSDGLSMSATGVISGTPTTAGPVSFTVTVTDSSAAGAKTSTTGTLTITVNLAPVLSITKTHLGNFNLGQQNATYTVTISNAPGAGPTVGTVTMTETVPAGLTLVSMAGTGWTCPGGGATCTRSDALAASSSYPVITVTVNVAANATSPQINHVSVSGGASVTANTTDSTVIQVPVLTITKSHVGNFTQGQQNATYTITVGNNGSAPTVGTVTMTETVPSGLTLVSMAGTGWTCPGGGTTCTRIDALTNGSSYPAITATVNVAANASTPQNNQVAASGGGSASANTSDSTIIVEPVLAITKTHVGSFTQGQAGATYTVTVSNTGTAPTSGTVTVTETVPTGLTLVSMAGTGWTCPGGGTTCTRSDALATASSYPTIAVTVNVAANASTPQVNQVSASGGGSATANGNDSTTIIEPVLTITKTHVGSFTQSEQNATYTVTVSNTGTAPTSGTVTVTETVPTGLTLVSMAGTGWTCPGGGTTCTRSDALATASSYPTITATVNVAANATSPQVNQIGVSGGGSASASTTDSTTINAVTVAFVSGSFNTIAPGASGVSVTASVTNDIGSQGVSWTITAGGSNCAPTCGTLSNVTTTSVTYTPPASVPGSPNNAPTLTATSIANTSKSASFSFTIGTAPCSGTPTGHESSLDGEYAFVLQGFNGSGGGTPIAYAGSFAASGSAGAGNITSGIMDISQSSGVTNPTILSSGSVYTVGADSTGAGNLGCVALHTSTGATLIFHFSLGSGTPATKGRIIEFDDSTGTGSRGSGILRLQTASAFSGGNTSALHTNYAFGLDGVDFAGGHFSIAGSLALNSGTGVVSNLAFDADDAGTLEPNVTGGTGAITGVNSATGRAVLTLTAGGSTSHEAMYIVNANEILIVQTDAFSGVNGIPIISGRAITTGSSFSSASLSGNYIIHLMGISGGAADINLGLLNLSSSTVNGTLYEYQSGSAPSTSTITGGTYLVSSPTGRVTLSGVGSNPPIIYLASSAADGISAFLVGTDGSSIFGFAEASSGSFTTAGLAGNYFFGTEDPGDNTVTDESGVATIASSGNCTGTQDDSGQSGLSTSLITSGGACTFTITNSPLSGFGNVGTGTIAITNGTRIFFFDAGGSNNSPAKITVLEQQ